MEDDLKSILGVTSDEEAEDLMLENPKLFNEKHKEYMAKKTKSIEEETAKKYGSFDDSRKEDLEKQGINYDALKTFASEIGANKITDKTLQLFKLQGATGDSISADKQSTDTPAGIGSGSRPNIQPKTTGEKLMAVRRSL